MAKYENDLARCADQIFLQLKWEVYGRMNNVGIWDEKKKIYRKQQGVSLNGIGDYLAVEPNGPCWFIEFKKGEPWTKKKLSYLNQVQKHFRDRVIRAGHIYLPVWFIDDLTGALKERGWVL